MPPVTAERSPPDSRITGADSPVIADSSTEPTPSITSPSAGIISPASTITTSPRWSSGAGTLRPSRSRGVGRRARRAQRVRLRLAAALGDRLGEVREQHRQPEPDRDHADEPELAVSPADEVEHEDDGGDDAAELDDEHHRVLQLQPRVELRERVPNGRERRARARRCSSGARPSALLPEVVEREVELEHVHARLAEEAPRATVGVLRDRASARSRAAGAGRRRSRRDWSARRPARCPGRCPSRRS